MPIRWGIVCAGKICHDFVNAVNTFPDKGDQVITAIAARNKQRAAEFAKQHNIPKVFDSYEALAASKDIDVAYIGALNPDHYALTKLFLENGKHVLCEKPLCLNFKQSQSLIELAQNKKLFLMEGVWSRFAPAYVALEKSIKEGNLGEIKFLEVNLGVPMQFVDRVTKKEFGGSVVLDIGVYTLQLCQYVFKDEPVRVSVVAGTVSDSGVDLMETIVLDYEGGRRAVMNLNAYIKMWNKATIYGTKGRYTGKNLNISIANTTELNKQDLIFIIPHGGLIESPRMTHKDSLILAKLQDEIRKQIGVRFDVDDQEYP